VPASQVYGVRRRTWLGAVVPLRHRENQDAGNVGSILRSAAAFGFKQVLALKGTAALWSPKVLRAGMGAHFGLQLIEGLEATKRISDDIQQKSALALKTQHEILEASEKYRSVANRSSLLFFLITDLVKILSYYIYSLAAFQQIFFRGIKIWEMRQKIMMLHDAMCYLKGLVCLRLTRSLEDCGPVHLLDMTLRGIKTNRLRR
jgi:hypothetical protein